MTVALWRGYLDLVQRHRIEGWARDGDQPEQPVLLRILDNGIPLGEVLADLYREDLELAGIGRGCHAFSFTVPGGLSPDHRHLIHVQRADDGLALPGSPVVMESAAEYLVSRSALPASWQGYLDIANRERIEGWAWDPTSPDKPLALVVLDNGAVIARVLANRYRKDLETSGMGNGRHAFTVTIPGGLSPLGPHVIQLLGEADGCEMNGSPVMIAPATEFDAALEHRLSAAVSALSTPDERTRVLMVLARQTEALLQQSADADAGRESRLLRRQLERRWGKDTALMPSPAPASDLRVLVIDDLVPTPDQDAGSSAILSHMRALRTLGYEVSFVASEDLSPTLDRSAALETLGIECCQTPYYVSVEEVLRRQRDCFDLIYLHRASNAAKYLALARHFCPRARVIYSVADLHHIRLARQAKIEQRSDLLAQSRRLRFSELAAASLSNAVITHSSAEAQLLRRAIPGCNVHVVPWAVPTRSSSVPWDERGGIAFIANFAHTPNLDAARVLTQQIMPRVWKQDPSIECLLVGSRMPEAIKGLAAARIVVMGHVPDLTAIYERVRLTVAPLRFGAGVKGKVLESLSAGVPCVMSPVAAEGIALPSSLAGLVCADVDTFAARIVRVHVNKAESESSAHAGLSFMSDGYGEALVAQRLKVVAEGRREIQS